MAVVKARIATVLLCWLGATAILLVLFTVFAAEIAALPLVPRILVVSGILTLWMTQLVMPIVRRVVRRWSAPIAASRPSTDARPAPDAEGVVVPKQGLEP